MLFRSLATLRKAIPRTRLRWALAALVLGAFVQVGGVAIYFGAQMREAGDYPYVLPLEHPRFMSDSHFNPRFSPIAGHWSMLVRNAAEHLRGEAPRLGLASGEPGSPGPPLADHGGTSGVGVTTADGVATSETRDARTGLSETEQRSLLHGLDFWWLYLGYAGVGGRAPILVAWLLAALAVAAAFRLRAALRAEIEAP